MDEEQARNDLQYQLTMSKVREMLDLGIISEKVYSEFNTVMIQKYCPKFGILYSDIELLNTNKQGNMNTDKE